MPNFRKVLLYGLLLITTGFALFLVPIFYQTYRFYYTHQVSFPESPRSLAKTEVYLIGTRHIPTDEYNQDTVYYHLEKIQPDLILLEMDSSFLRGDRLKRKYTFVMRFYPFLRKYWNLEMLAATKYAKYSDEVRLGPFEWEGKRDIIKEIRNKRSALNKALFETRTDSSNQIFHERGKILFHYLKELTTLHDFNTLKNDAVMERSKYLDYDLIPRMVLANDSLDENHEFAKKYQSYWPTRNEQMAENIIKAIELNPAKKIVVLTGYAHRYFLRELLNESPHSLDFDLLDYQGKPL